MSDVLPVVMLCSYHTEESAHSFNMLFPEAQRDLFVAVTQRSSQSAVKSNDVSRQSSSRPVVFFFLIHSLFFFFLFLNNIPTFE